MTKAQIIDKYINRIMIDYPEADKIHIDLLQFAEELQQSGDNNLLQPIPDWIIKYDQANHQSSAGKAIRFLIQRTNQLEHSQNKC